MIVIVDYGVGNVGSIVNMLRRGGASAIVSAKSEEIRSADGLILPGVGAFDAGMKQLAGTGLMEALSEAVLGRKTPILGICMGMQLFMRASEEGDLPGLGWIDGEVVRFKPDPQAKLKVPHMGWNTVSTEPAELFHGLEAGSRFYFVHSYYVACSDDREVIGRTQHGLWFHSSVRKDNILGVQFHPEKSHRFGMALLKNFAERIVRC